ncbi:energy transducer TonB [Novosphingobium sp. Leaf2]|uniref:energy transducer TonB n=1 Tax=Novosphingobium sp. Leaf2 TaxID=1735670 RepID=UPI0006FA39F9|nr:energy transducer TonB [Novosphingobium sp. Leaf2]KQM21880.1 hypothetical protein ASE49_00750 [Novosphingobium sp. Leaf2]
MYIRSITGLFLLLAAGQPALAAPKETVLAPASPWNLDATPSGCALRRAFGTGTPALMLEMNRNAPSQDFELIVIGEEMRGIAKASELFYRLGRLPNEKYPLAFIPGTTVRGEAKNIPTVFATAALTNRAYQMADAQLSLIEGQATDITLEWSNKRLTLGTGSLAKPFALMRQCTAALVKSWGLDPEEQRMLSRRLEPIDVNTWGQQIGAATTVGMTGGQARINVRLIVDSNGVPTDCTVLRSYNKPVFDAAACRLLKRIARFKPALNRQGKPVASYYTNTVVWRSM